MQEIEFARNLITKFCHDIAGVISATTNSIEYIDSNDPKTKKKATELLSASASQAMLRLKFFRHTYGELGMLQEADLDNIKILSSEYLEEKNINLAFDFDYSYKPEIFVSMEFGRLILCMVYIISEDLFEGGDLLISIIKGKDGLTLELKASGPRIKADKGNFAILENKDQKEPKEIDPFNIHYIYTRSLIAKLGYQIKKDRSVEGKIRYILEK